MASGWDWEGDESLLRFDDPAEWDAAQERGEGPLGSAVIGLAFNCSLADASPRIIKAMQLPDHGQRGFAYTAVGVAARVNGGLTPELFAALRAEGHRGFAETAVDDTLDYVPFRELPLWFKWRTVASKVQDKLATWRLNVTYAAEDARKALRRRRT
ncbi:hypothetical protein ACFQ0X_13565 [Streptomyces rectiviolaceus]|uniref:Uncharacterized protein n=1 Tax=Streptomyces rectiviolaceus TaxID=332591 RepID=A0ABP6MWW1_9ACTN